MGLDRKTARLVSYASSARSRGGRAMIRTLENATGRLRLIRRARGYETEIDAARDVWQILMDRFGLSLAVFSGSLANIPRTGPLVVISNHPYGILDGLVMAHVLSATRGDFRILAHRVFRGSDELDRVILPINFDETREAIAQNVETRKRTLGYLAQGGAVGIFPSGTVSTAARPFGPAMDTGWRSFTARMIARSDAAIVPIFFDGANSRLFQLASHLHQTLRMGLLIKEFRARTDAPVRLAVGEPIAREALAPYRHDPRALMDFLRERTYALSPRPLASNAYGFEFEARYKLRPARQLRAETP